jgi:hypothetical protein
LLNDRAPVWKKQRDYQPAARDPLGPYTTEDPAERGLCLLVGTAGKSPMTRYTIQ